MDIYLLIYLAGYLWFWRYIIGAIVHDVVGNEPDGVDYLVGVFIGSIVTLAWPPVVVIRLVYVLAKKYGDVRAFESFFPAAKEIETKAEREERLMREREEAVWERQRAINAHERENGLELTRWNE